MSSAVSFQFENQKKAEIEIESLQKTKSNISVFVILYLRFFWDIRIIWDFCKKRLDLVYLNPSIHPL